MCTCIEEENKIKKWGNRGVVIGEIGGNRGVGIGGNRGVVIKEGSGDRGKEG